MQYLQFCDVPFMLILFLLSASRIIFAIDVQHQGNNTGTKLCTSKICVEAGNEIIESLDHSVDPCNDFYHHACGGWIENHPIPDNLESASQFNVIAMKSQNQLMKLLKLNRSTDGKTMRKVKNYYHSCQDLAAIDARGLAPLEAVVSANGGWPLTLPSNQNQKLTLQTIRDNYAKITSSSALYSIEVLPDLLNSSVRILQLRLPLDPIDRIRWFLPRRNKRHDYDSAYAEYTEAVAKEFTRLNEFNVSLDGIEDDVKKMLEFEAALPDLSISNSTKYEVVTIADVQNQWNAVVSGHFDYAIDWLESIRNIFEGTDIVINATEKIGLLQRNFVTKLAALLIKTPLRTVVNYVHWHAIDSFVPVTNEKMRKITNNLIKHLYGYEDNDEDRPIFCIGHHKMLEGLSYFYVKKYFRRSLTNAVKMVNQIQAEMKRTFDQSMWMDDETKFRCKEKVDSMITNIGYPSWYEPKKINEFYRKLEIGPNYFENVVSCNRFDLMTSLKRLREPYDRYKAPWAFPPIILGGAYRRNDNSMNIPAVNLQMPFYHDGRPMVMNYGSIGSLIGHEISHGFDEGGRKYDKFGNMEELCSAEAIAKYDEKIKCFVDQYNNYTFVENYMNETIKIDGDQTLDENIADNTGFMIALKAYRSYKKEDNFEDLIIPALKNYSDEKLFFYSLGNFFCSSWRTEVLTNARAHAEHSPFSIRVNGVLSNIQEFSQAFNCPSGSPMNPVKKCNLWD